MSTTFKSIPWVAILAVAFASEAAAEDDGGYQPDIKPGMNLRSEESAGGSLLSRAARDRVSVVIGGEGARAIGEDVKTYVVRSGDTLWDICTRFFGDPYDWPRIWSYNTRITNPHWIYPGDLLWLVPPEQGPAMAPASVPAATPQAATAGRRRPQMVLVRNRGFVDAEILRQSGTIVGSQKEVMMLSQYDEAYTDFPPEAEVRVGDEFAAFEVIRAVDSVEDPGTEVGKLVEILGAVRVIGFDRRTHIARVTVDESLKPIERGTMIGPVHRRFDLVPAVANEREIQGRIIAFLDPTILAATHQIVFVDKGREEGVKEGNRFLVIEQRDRYRKSNAESDDREGYPFEILAELRVIEARPHTSTCLVTASTLELEVGGLVDMVQGY
jgi:hypothetical protein